MHPRKLLVLFFVALSAALCYAEQLQTPDVSEWTPLTSREEVENFLRTATVVKAKQLGTGVTNPIKLTLENGAIQHFGVFKSIDERKMGIYKLAGTQEFDFKDSWMFEVAAYELDKALDMNMVPPTVERIYEGKKGSVQWWVPNAMTEGDRIEKKLAPPDTLSWSQQVAKMRIFDALIYNIDRNLGNILINPAWRVYLIDHSRSFKNLDTIKSEKDLTYFPRSLMEHLRKLDPDSLEKCTHGYLRSAEIKMLLKRRDMLVKYYDQQVAQNGQSITFP